MSRLTILLLVFLSSIAASSAESEQVAHNARIEQLFAEDQDDRRGFPNTKLAYKEINVRDEARRNEILGMLKRTEVRTTQDYFYAAVIFHHGQTFEHYRMSASLAWMAHELEPENSTYAWQTASSWNRMMLKKTGRSGMAFRRIETNKSAWCCRTLMKLPWSDVDRATYNVKPLSELRDKPGRSPIKPLP